MADRFKKLMHKRIGVGGIKCHCCNVYLGKKRKILRRLARMQLKREDKINIEKENS